MTESHAKADLRLYLQDARDALLWKLDGLSEYDIRRPMTPTGTNLLGLVKHLTGAEAAYFGETFGRLRGRRSGSWGLPSRTLTYGRPPQRRGSRSSTVITALGAWWGELGSDLRDADVGGYWLRPPPAAAVPHDSPPDLARLWHGGTSDP